jgi:hypothetical protein
MASIKDGTWVRMSASRGVPIRYQNRSGFVVGKQKSDRGAKQLLVEFPGRRSTPLIVSERFATAL